MHIAHIGVNVGPPLLSTRGGAIQRRIMEMARAQVAQGHHVVAYSTGAQAETRWVDGVEVRFVPCRLPLPFRHAEFQLRVLGQIGRAPCDVAHFHSQPEGALLTRGRARCTVLTYDYFLFRGGRRGPLGGLYRWMLRRFDALLPCSDYCAAESSAYWDLPAERVHVVYNGVNLAQFRPDSVAGAHHRALLPGTGPVLLYVGRVCTQKGTDVLLDAVAALQRSQPVRLVIAGPMGQFGEHIDEEAWRARIAAVGGTYLGAVEDADLAGIYNACDVFVMPTRAQEMFGMAAVEAQACGKPVVASDHGGLREVVPEACGARVPVGDAAALAAAVAALLGDDARRAAAGEAAIANAARFRWGRITEDLDAVYRRVCPGDATASVC